MMENKTSLFYVANIVNIFLRFKIVGIKNFNKYREEL